MDIEPGIFFDWPLLVSTSSEKDTTSDCQKVLVVSMGSFMEEGGKGGSKVACKALKLLLEKRELKCFDVLVEKGKVESIDALWAMTEEEILALRLSGEETREGFGMTNARGLDERGAIQEEGGQMQAGSAEQW